MKAIIVTTQYVYNYGAVLQAYGMHCFLEQNLWEHEFLNQIPQDRKLFAPVLPLNKKTLYNCIINIRRIKNISHFNSRKKAFDLFVETNFPQTNKFSSQYEIVNSDLNYDLYITGGDQMFNRSCLSRPVNLLEFGNENAKRISYSTSFGSAVFSDSEKQSLLKKLENYSEISLRESKMIEFFDKDFSVPVRYDIDASLLVDTETWRLVEKKVCKIPEKYILVYELLPHDNLDKTVQAASRYYELPVVVITSNDKSNVIADYYIRNAGPAEFLWLFDHSSAVITTSFHGTCFSIIFEKPFFSLVRKNETRINGILDLFELRDRYNIEFEKWPQHDPDFTIAHKKIKEGRIHAYEYLERYFNE